MIAKKGKPPMPGRSTVCGGHRPSAWVTPTLYMCVQAELDQERERSKAETATRDSKIAGLFDELAAAQAEMHEARAAVDQVGALPA